LRARSSNAPWSEFGVKTTIGHGRPAGTTSTERRATATFAQSRPAGSQTISR
jgi:hypothetical protein